MKVESKVDALNEVEPICMNTDEVYVPSDVSIIKTETEVSLVLRSFYCCDDYSFMCVCMCMYINVFYTWGIV
jgi:hypothetical protein